MAHYKIYNRVSHLLIFYLLVFDRIHDAVCLNKMFRTSSRNIGPQHQKYSSIFHSTHGVLFPLCSPNPSWVFAAKKLIFLFHLTIEASPISSSRVWQLNILSLFLDELRYFFLKPFQTTCGDVGAVWQFVLRFSDLETQLFSAILQLWSLEYLATQTSFSRTLGTIWAHSFVTVFVDWKFLIIGWWKW